MSRPLALLLFGLLACGGNDEHDEHANGGHGHHDEHGAHHLTAWSDTLELFVVQPALTANEAVDLVLHLTRLDGFRPYDGEVHATVAGERHEARRLAPGTFRLHVTLPSGDHDLEVETDLGAVSVALRTDAPHEHADGQIELTKEQQWSVRFATTEATRAELRPTVEVTGELTTPPGGSAHVHAPVAGRVSAPRGGLPSPGDAVRAGQLLATLAPTPSSPEDATRAGLAVVDAEARVEAARLELERARNLLAQQAVPARRVQDAERGLRVAEAALDASRRARALYASAQRGSGRGGWRITAPIAGVVDAVDVSPGEAVDTNELLFRILDPETLWIHGDVPETWATRLHTSSDAAFQLVGDPRWRPLSLGEGGNARLVNVARSVDPRTRTVAVVYELLSPSDDALRVGAAIRAALPVGEAQPGVRVPRTAILDAEARSVVVVQVEGELFEERPVRVGVRDGEHVAIEDGVEAGERVVAEGGQYVRLAGLANSSVGHGHVH